MRTRKPIIAAALIAPVLALGGGVAYASTTSGSQPGVTRPAVTSTVQAHRQHTATQARYGRDWRYGDRCDWRGTTRHPASGHRRQQSTGYQHRRGYRYGGSPGTWGYQGCGQYGSGYRQGNGSGNCGDCGGNWR